MVVSEHFNFAFPTQMARVCVCVCDVTAGAWPVKFENSSLVETSGIVDESDLLGCYEVCSGI